MFSVLSLCLFAVPSLASYSASDDVITLDSSNFQSKVINSDDLWIVEFYAPWCGHCQALEPEYKNAAKALKGIVKLGAVDADSDKSLGGQYGIKGFPTIKVFGSNKNKPTDYQGARSASGIVDSAMSLLKSLVQERLSGKKGGGGSRSSGKPEDVIELTDANFDELVMKSDDLWLVEFFAPWCGHCKNLAPHWQSAASDLKGKVKLGALDATVHTIVAGRYQVQGYPTIKYFPSGKKDEPLEYDGGRTGNDIVQWATDKLAENVPPPEVVELTEHSQLESSCNDHQLCVVSFLPNILDCQSECRNKFLQILKNMGEKYKKKMWGWLWMEGGAQLDMEDAFGIGGFGYPAMAAMNARKMKFSLMKGSFSETGINEFLRELAVGRGSTAPVKNAKLPSVFKREPWDGKDGVLPVEEDIDLSDVDLDDLDTKKDEL